MKRHNIWILTRSHNDYNQYGEYFVGAFMHRPTKQEIFSIVNPPYPGCNGTKITPQYDPEDKNVDEFLTHIINGGGRQRVENDWYELDVFDTNTQQFLGVTSDRK